MIALEHGPYLPPAVPIGAVLRCAYRETDVVVEGFCGSLRWPGSTAPRQGGRPSKGPRPIVCGDLLRALRQETATALADALNTPLNTVSRWRRLLRETRDGHPSPTDLDPHRRVQFVAGPYEPPEVKVGERVYCEVRRSMVIVGGFSRGPIPWPRLKKTGRAALIVFADLARAVRTESAVAVAEHWGVSVTTVAAWRRELGAKETPGTRALHRAYGPKKLPPETAARGREKARSPEAREKISASKRGKPVPEQTRKALLRAARRPKSAAHRRAIGEAVKRSGHRPRHPDRPDWTAEEDSKLRRGVARGLTDREIAADVGRSPGAIRSHRRRLGLQRD